MNRPFGAAFALGLMLATASLPGFGQAAADQGGSPVSVGASRVPLDAANPRQDRVGRLVYRGGLRLASGDARFGGLSALLVPAEGDRFVAVSDKGRWVSGTLAFNAAGDLTGVGEVTLQAILGPGGRRLTMRPWRDAESLARDRDGSLIVSFEHVHRLWRYADPAARPTRVPPPPRLQAAPPNGGIEALTVRVDGSLFALAEDLETAEGVVGWLGEADGTWRAFAYAVDGGYRPTGAAALPDGGVLVLERRFPPLGVRLRFVRNESLTPAALRGSPVVKAEAVANFAPSMTMDNMEGVDVLVTGDGRRLVFLVSDDNFSALQSTLLMMFEWPQGEAGDASR